MLNGSNKIPTDWQAIYQLLRFGKYGQVAEALYQVQLTGEEVGDSIAATIAAVVRQICLACSQCRNEIDWHYAARQTAEQREEQLKYHAQAILNHIYKQAGSDRREVTSPAELYRNDWRKQSQEVLQRGEYLLTSEYDELPLRWPGAIDLPITLATQKTEEELVFQTLDVVAQDGMPVSQSVQYVNELSAESRTPKQEVPTIAVDPIPILAEMHEGEPSNQERPTLAVYCLGKFWLYQDDQPVNDWPSSKGQSIFKYLILHRKYPIAKETLMDLFWPESLPDAARNNLNVAIYGLRRALRAVRTDFSHVLYRKEHYLLNPELRIWIDAEAFTHHVVTGQHLEQEGKHAEAMREYRVAEVLYQGEFLSEDRYEDWIASQRQRLQEDYLKILARLGNYSFAQENYDTSAILFGKILAVDSCREDAHCSLMRAYYRHGHIHLAIRQYHICVDALQKELDVEPSPETQFLYQQIHNRMGV